MSAESYAREAHASDLYGDQPYTVHLEEVVAIVRDYDERPQAEAVAWLHDVLEDHPEVSGADLAQEFGGLVAMAVLLVTDPEGKNRREKKALLHERLARLHPEVSAPARLALLVKAADRLANVRASVAGDNQRKLKMYRKEHPEFRAAAERPLLFAPIWDELDQLLGVREENPAAGLASRLKF